MKRKISLKTRLMITTSILLVVVSILFTVFSVLNAYVNFVQPLEKMYLEQQSSTGFIPKDIIITVNGNPFFTANIIFMVVTIVVGGALTYVVARFSLKPLKIWSEEMANIDQHQLSKRIENSNTKDELDTLANSFNQLLDRLQRGFDREKRFSAAAAHELKTPLTVVKANIEVLQMDENPEVEDYAETIEVIKKQNDRMIQLVSDLMLLSSANVQEQSDFVDMDTIISEIENDLEVSLLSKNIKFEYNKVGFQMKGNAVLMKHALSNLIENAIKYSTTDGMVSIFQKIEENQYTISVRDSGIGISKEDIPYIFEPFYRADKSRNRSVGGSGLGLAITKEIIEGHNGCIKYQAREEQGSEFVISIPTV